MTLAVAGGTAFAQDELASAPASVEDGGLGEIVVTAQHREESLQRAAIAVTAVQADDLERAGVTDTLQLPRVAPALQIGSIGGTLTQYYLRGVGNFTANSLSDAAIAVNLDGVPIVRSTAVQGMFYDLERVEVLKGPQGTLYGRNATGGAINVITASPHIGEYSGYVNAEVGNFEATRVTGALNAPVGDNAAVRFAGVYADHDGYYSDGTGDEDMYAFRLQGAADLNDVFSLRLGGDYAHFESVGGGTLFGLDRDERIGTTDPRADAVYASTLSFPAGSFLSPLEGEAFTDNTYWGIFAQGDLDTALGTLTIIPSYREADILYRSPTTFVINDRMNNDQFTLEARLASDEDNRLSYLIGGFYLDENVHQTPAYAEQFFNAYGTFDSDTQSSAVFGRLTFNVTDQFRLTAGARYTEDDKSGVLSAYNLLVVCTDPSHLCIGTPTLPQTDFDIPSTFLLPNGDPIPVQPWGSSGAIVLNDFIVNDVSQTFTKTTYHIGFDYDITPNSFLYGSYETGFKAGGFFNSIDDPVYAPETIGAYTLGLKNRFFDNRLLLNFEAFWWNYEDQQVSHFRLNSVGGSEFVTENIGETEIQGLEVEARARVLEGTTLNATVQYLNAETVDYVYTNPAVNGPPATGCPTAFLTGGPGPGDDVFQVNCSGRDAIQSPEWTVNAGIEQVFHLGNEGSVILNLDGHYQTSYYAGVEQLSSQLEDAYTTFDFQAQYEAPGGQFKVAAFVNNLTDESVVAYAVMHPFAPGLVVESLRPPRTYGVRLGYEF